MTTPTPPGDDPDGHPWALDVLGAFEGVLDEIGENLDYWSLGGGDETADEAGRRLRELIAITLQALASDITDSIAREPAFSSRQIVDRLRRRAASLAPGTDRWYDPQTQLDADIN